MKSFKAAGTTAVGCLLVAATMLAFAGCLTDENDQYQPAPEDIPKIPAGNRSSDGDFAPPAE